MQIMIDIERLFPSPGIEQLQIAAVSFDYAFQPQEAMEILNNPDRWINVLCEYETSAHEPSAAKFWAAAEQKPALDLINAMPKVELSFGLTQLSTFVKSYLGNRANVWAKPPSFDLQILRELYWRVAPESEEDPCPWRWNQEGCLRTTTWLADRVPRKKFRLPDTSATGIVRHYALHDAVSQVILAQGAYRALLETARGQ